MSLRIAPQDLPEKINVFDVVELAYPTELTEITLALDQRRSCLIECARELVPFVFLSLRKRVPGKPDWLFIEGKARPDNSDNPQIISPPAIQQMIQNLTRTVRGALDNRIVVLPHLDLMTTHPNLLTPDAKEVLTLLHENPALLWIGFRDPGVPIPPIIEEMAHFRHQLGGVDRSRLRHLLARREARKFGDVVDLGAIHQRVSGVNALHLRRLLEVLNREDLPINPERALRAIREMTLAPDLCIPQETFDDIPGHADLKQQIRDELLDVLAEIDETETEEERASGEELIPREILLTGKNDCTKRQFARAIANAMGAVLIEVTGPELTSKYFGESEENVRRLFQRARQCTPSVILFQHLHWLGKASSGSTAQAETSMLLQMIQSMEKLSPSERVFVMGTAPACDQLDPRLSQPGRFELTLHVGKPSTDDLSEYLDLLNAKHRLQLADAAQQILLDSCQSAIDPTGQLRLLCRRLGRLRIREVRDGSTTPTDVREVISGQ